ncbi:ParB/RepB/Spo0J family partition protein [Streptomyces kaniharaensis]|uniref:ParB/RepB/Spo0J family partition protein n=1 Tax=Streptomyces kaniharaensis TaxID=212423 RepID=A0A6N7KXV5_9ACTN|nr:ParB/RepB/Spo0J family partition protein [Streptomyces kaniharaensis]MQS16516.1 ParB/RepB/Spo0J family partition protein [Streptomyces kaniharaensis]
MKAADRLAGGGSFGALAPATSGHTRRSERGRAKAQAEGMIPDYEIQRLPLARVALCPKNPRRNYGTEEQREALGQSLAKKQTTACVVVTRAAYLALWPQHEILIGKDAEFVLLNGERRHRSATQVGLEVLDFVVRDDLATSQADFMDYLMAENEDREDFNIIERALGLEQLLKACGGNAAEVARRRGRDRSWVGNQILLLNLPPAIQDRLASGEMAERYGRRLARAFKDDRALTVDDLLAFEEQLKEEERAKRIAQRDALKMLSADNISPVTEPTAEEPSVPVPALSADNTPTDSPQAAAPDAKPATAGRSETSVLSADNTSTLTSQPSSAQGRASNERASDSVSTPVMTPLPRQQPAVSPAAPADLVRALGKTAQEQATTLKAGLSGTDFIALVEELHAHV